ncbi:MAG: protein translocase subunit SecF [Leptolyngbyaceae cyanobacterium HOT.MB2.61]|jgi:preprotein translocase subunit SecF|nr:protein translocase subunit SecF [Leptolyngbyaceae cyanobacterium HOT.MB2.61]
MKLQVIKQRNLWWAISVALILAGIAAMVISWQQFGAPLRPSLDFIGGTRLQFELDCAKSDCSKPIDIAAVRSILVDQGLGNSSVQEATSRGRRGVSIRTSPLSPEQRSQLQSALSQKIGTFDPSKTQIDTVGPVLGQQILSSGLLALLVAFAGITIYLSLRFQLDYAIFSLVALAHDVLITVGSFSVLGLVLGVEVDSLFIVALLTIVGFSVNDTVVIYDRVRETLALNPDRSIDEVVDMAVNQTLTRSVNTTFTTLLPLFAIFLFGGETLKYFALALIIGFIAGAYSSIFIASTLLALWRERTEKLAPATVIDSSVSDSPSSPPDASS